MQREELRHNGLLFLLFDLVALHRVEIANYLVQVLVITDKDIDEGNHQKENVLMHQDLLDAKRYEERNQSKTGKQHYLNHIEDPNVDCHNQHQHHLHHAHVQNLRHLDSHTLDCRDNYPIGKNQIN